jgi:two-component system sensor histidine kinase RegB
MTTDSDIKAPSATARFHVGLNAQRGAQARVRLGTLNNLRWLAVLGQTAALLVTRLVLNFDFPLPLAATPIAVSAVLNIVLAIAYPSAKRLSAREATAFLAYDILQLAALLYFTGGIENPFALLFLAPVVVSAATLDLTSTLFLAGLSVASVSFLVQAHYPLPWMADDSLRLPALYQGGIWVSLVLGIGFTSIYAWRIAGESSRMSAALSATQLALARENRLGALGALAAAAAHELGTPLATIAVVAHELEREHAADAAHADDFRLLRAQAERCRSILARLAKPEESVLGHAEQLPLGALLDDIAAPHRGVDVSIKIELQSGPPPKIWRVPEILHGLGNLIENAADFAAHEVRLRARWTDSQLVIEVMDDGPGFAAEIFEQIGEPYVTSRPGGRGRPLAPDPSGGKQEGMGLGFFIAKTLIERTGGKLTAANRMGGGAIVTATWPRGAIDGDEPPQQELLL